MSLPRNVLAIRRVLAGTSSSTTVASYEIITSLTSKSSNASLLDYPPGAYTGMRTIDRIGIMDFTGHTNRLASSLQQIKFPGRSTARSGSGSGSEGSEVSEELGVLEEDPLATSRLAALRTPETMKKETTDLVRVGLKFYYSQLREAGMTAAATTTSTTTADIMDETKVTVLCTWDDKAKQPTLIAHFESLEAPRMPRCKVEIHGAPRHHATAKDSQWVRDRQSLLEAMDKDSNEALLMDSSQDLYEGLSSNFCVFHRQRRTLLTAPVGSVLQGTILKVVLDVCKTENIPVEYTFPNLKHIDEWEGAFISSTSRFVLPIEKLVMPDRSIRQIDDSPTIELIRKKVLDECRKRVENLISEQDV